MSTTTLPNDDTVRTRVLPVQLPQNPAGIVLVLHGGARRRDRTAVSPSQLSVLRMIPIARRVARAGEGRLAVFRVLNSTRGWDEGRTPAADALHGLQEALHQVGRELPAALVGHSLGGRAALLTAGHAAVRSVVALAPWVYPGDAPPHVEGKSILIVHGEQDPVASPERSAAVARSLSARNSVSYVNVVRGRHAMLRRGEVFERLAAEYVRRTLLVTPQEGARRPRTSGVPEREGRVARTVTRALQGEPWLEI